MIEYLKELSELKGPSGREDEVKDYIKSKLEEKGIFYEEDFFGNLYVFKRGKAEIKLNVCVMAHIDEVGVIVTGYTSDGYLKFRPIGGLDAEILPGNEIIFLNGTKGIVISLPPHRKKQIEYSFKNLVIDIGAYSSEEAKSRVDIGEEGVFMTKFEEIGKEVYKGKSFDNRAGTALVLSLILDEEIPFDTNFVFTVQEETGLLGARVSSSRRNFDLAFIIEGTFAFEPYHPEEEYYPKLGYGPVITKMDKSLIVNEVLINYVERAAFKNNIKFQWKIPFTGSTDGGPVSLTNRGVKTLVMAIPCRYIHSKASLIFKEDLYNTKKLLLKIMEEMYGEDFKGIM
ncbi:MAG: M42 family peptidase [Candidatus Hydrothermales bacterium]